MLRLYFRFRNFGKTFKIQFWVCFVHIKLIFITLSNYMRFMDIQGNIIAIKISV